MNHEKNRLFWSEEVLSAVVKRRRKRVGVSKVAVVAAEKTGEVWGVDCKFDSTVTGKLIKLLSIVDEHTRECLGGVVDYSTAALDLAAQLPVLAIERRIPRASRMDNGPGFISNTIADWASETERVFIRPGRSWRNGYFDSFNGKLKDECATIKLFYLRKHAKCIIGLW